MRRGKEEQAEDAPLGRVELEGEGRPPVLDVPDPQVPLRVPRVEQGAAGAQHGGLDVAAVGAEGAERRRRWGRRWRRRTREVEAVESDIVVVLASAAL